MLIKLPLLSEDSVDIAIMRLDYVLLLILAISTDPFTRAFESGITVIEDWQRVLGFMMMD